MLRISTNWFSPDRACRATMAALLCVVAVGLAGCQALREVANLRNVQFAIDRVAEPQLAGVDLSRVDSYRDLSASDVLRLTRAAATGEMPLSFTLLVDAENPADNEVAARLVTMDWTLLLDETETVQGRFDNTVRLEPGMPTTVPIPIELDLVRFFGDNARDLIDLALAVAGEGDPKTVTLRATPSIETVLGPIRYPEPITITRRDVGQRPSANQP
jgi:hypothetical protein